MILTPARNPDEYLEQLDGWQQAYVRALRQAIEEEQDTPLGRDTVQTLVQEASRLNRVLGDPTVKSAP
ncbi:hypothetical protein A8M77_20280 [Variovorax sp. JS1663]|nr:hypothetical protein A8M77_20280 [Variovorax sp. JS1663]